MLNFVAKHGKFDTFMTRVIKQRHRLRARGEILAKAILAKTWQRFGFQFSLASRKKEEEEHDSSESSMAKYQTCI